MRGCYLKSGGSTPPRGICITYWAMPNLTRPKTYKQRWQNRLESIRQAESIWINSTSESNTGNIFDSVHHRNVCLCSLYVRSTSQWASHATLYPYILAAPRILANERRDLRNSGGDMPPLAKPYNTVYTKTSLYQQQCCKARNMRTLHLAWASNYTRTSETDYTSRQRHWRILSTSSATARAITYVLYTVTRKHYLQMFTNKYM